jgi:uncharacterized protein
MAKLAGLMPPDLPFAIEPEKIALSAKVLVGEIALQGMSRLTELVRINNQKAVYNLSFSKGGKGTIQITGEVSTTLVMPCQRCLKDMTLMIRIPVAVGVVNSQDDITYLAADLEPFIAEDGKISLLKLIEEEILLSLPISTLHSDDECSASDKLQDHSAKPVSPFAVLKKIKEGN